MAAEQGDRNAMLRLAEMYKLGRGVPRDSAEAKRWIQRNNASVPRKVNRQEMLLTAIGLILGPVDIQDSATCAAENWRGATD